MGSKEEILKDALERVAKENESLKLQVETYRRVLKLVELAARQDEWMDHTGSIQQDAWVAVTEALRSE